MSEDNRITLNMKNFLSYVPLIKQVTLRHRASHSAQQEILTLLTKLQEDMPHQRARYTFRHSKIGGYLFLDAEGDELLIDELVDRATEAGWKEAPSVRVSRKVGVRHFTKGEPMTGQNINAWNLHSQRALERQIEAPRRRGAMFSNAETASIYRQQRGIQYGEEEARTAALMNLATKNLSDEVIEENVSYPIGRAKHSQAINSRKQRAIYQTQKRKGGGHRSLRKTRSVTRKTRQRSLRKTRHQK